MLVEGDDGRVCLDHVWPDVPACGVGEREREGEGGREREKES